ncbi:MAG: putative translation initiation inhibitor, yjgF family [Planctomycetaceae bacterium]|nr:putative translation initiation inhibitor, yjgF family [Planctomycetaceae bacterium]
MSSGWKFFLILCCLSLTQGSVNAAEPKRSIRPDATIGTASAVISTAEQLIQTAQLFPVDQQQQLIGAGDASKQIEQTLDNLQRVLMTGGSELNAVVKLNCYVANDDLVPVIQKSLVQRFHAPALPAVSFVTTRLPISEVLVAVDAIAELKPVSASGIPPVASESRYLASSRVAARTLHFISGQAEKGANLPEATRKTLLSLEASLKFCGRSKLDVRQIKCFLTPMSKIADVRSELEAYYGAQSIPPVSFVEWQSTLPIEIEVLADGMPETGLEPPGKLVYLTPPGMSTSPVFSRICRIHESPLIFVSGLYGQAGSNGTQQVETIFGDLGAILKESGGDLQHLVKATYYVSQDEPSQKLNELRPRYYNPKSPPAASKAQVTGVGRPGTGLTIDMIAIPAGIAPK